MSQDTKDMCLYSIINIIAGSVPCISASDVWSSFVRGYLVNESSIFIFIVVFS